MAHPSLMTGSIQMLMRVGSCHPKTEESLCSAHDLSTTVRVSHSHNCACEWCNLITAELEHSLEI